MALNPPINSEGQPMRVEGEYFAILRKNMEIEVKIEGLSKLTAKGKVSKIYSQNPFFLIILALCHYSKISLC